jgi:transposase
MVTIGIDAHKRSHTAVAVDAVGRSLGTRTVPATAAGHLELVRWAAGWSERRWAVEDCRQLTRRLEADLLRAGEPVVRVPPKLMADARRPAREPGKSDPIDALAVARAALREPHLPLAVLDGAERELRLLVDHREDLVAERTRAMNRLRWHLHELSPDDEPAPRSLDRRRVLDRLEQRLADVPGLVARLARELVAVIASLTQRITALEREIAARSGQLSPSLRALRGCGALSAAKIVGETAGVLRFRHRAAFARHTGTAPVPVWSGNTERHRLSRGGNRQLNAAIHRIAVTQLQRPGPAQDYVARRRAAGDTPTEALRALKRRISDEVWRRLRVDELATTSQPAGQEAAA